MSSHQPGQQQYRGEFHAEQVGPEQRDAHGFHLGGRINRFRRPARQTARHAAPRHHIDELEQQRRRQHAGDDPGARPHPLPLAGFVGPARVDEHKGEEEQHHDGAGVDDHLEGRHERRSEHIEHQGQRQK